MISKKNEIVEKTRDINRLYGKYLKDDILKRYTEEFVDKDSGEVVPIERNEVLFCKGDLIDNDTLSKINFYMQCGDIKGDITISNQRRRCDERKYSKIYPYLVTVSLNEKKKKFVCMATCIRMAEEIVKDFIELNYEGWFTISGIKDMDNVIVLLKDDDGNMENVKECLELSSGNRKYYQCLMKIFDEAEMESMAEFLVEAVDMEEGQRRIDSYIKGKSSEIFGQNEMDFKTVIEEAKPFACHVVIDREFSMAYMESDGN